MRKKIVVIAGLAGAVTLTGLAGAAYAADGNGPVTVAKPAQATIVSCEGKTVTGKPGVGPRTFSFRAGPEVKGKMLTAVPAPGLKVEKPFADGKGLSVQKFDGKGVPAGAIKLDTNGLKGLKAAPGKDIKCAFVPKDGVPLPAPAGAPAK